MGVENGTGDILGLDFWIQSILLLRGDVFQVHIVAQKKGLILIFRDRLFFDRANLFFFATVHFFRGFPKFISVRLAMGSGAFLDNCAPGEYSTGSVKSTNSDSGVIARDSGYNYERGSRCFNFR